MFTIKFLVIVNYGRNMNSWLVEILDGGSLCIWLVGIIEMMQIDWRWESVREIITNFTGDLVTLCAYTLEWTTWWTSHPKIQHLNQKLVARDPLISQYLVSKRTQNNKRFLPVKSRIHIQEMRHTSCKRPKYNWK